MKAKKPGWALVALMLTFAVTSMVACGSGEVVLVQSNGENRVQPIKFGHSNIYLIKTDSGHILVDAGMPDMEAQLDAVFEEAGVDPKSVRLIIASHGHLDHVGSIAYAKRVTGAEVLCHRTLSDYLVNGEAEPAIARNLLGRMLNFLTGLGGNKFEGVRPDILVDDEFDLNDYGISGKIICTPGHSPSSISIMLANGEALVGDLIRGEDPDKLGLGMFYEDRQALLRSLERVVALEPRVIYLSHGDRIDNSALRDCIEANQSK